jgi:hypothetical protein
MTNVEFAPTARDYDGLTRILDRIRRDHDGHEGYKVECFSRPEAEWIKAAILRSRPDLHGRLFTSWLVFPPRDAAHVR